MRTDPYDIFLHKFGSFTDVQKAAMPVVETGGNCVIMAPTGSGKTEAAVVPLLAKLPEGGTGKGIGIIYITPLRALNRDLLKRLSQFASELGVSISVRHGDTPTKERQLQAVSPPYMLITTPETLQNLFLSQRLRNAMGNVKAVVVDELHELYYNKRGAQLAVALERLEELAPGYQRIGISATLGNAKEAGTFLCGNRDFKTVDAKGSKEIRVSIEMPRHASKEHVEFSQSFNLDGATLARIERVAELVEGSNSTLIFANTRQVVESLGSKLVYFDKLAHFGGIGVHHSSLDKEERIKSENEFKEGRVKSIIATSSLELGIDIGAVNLVIQYGSPKQVVRLVQRVGRGGHREKETSFGSVIVASPLEVLESVAITEQMREGVLEKGSMERNALDVLANQICAMVLEYRKIEETKLLGIVRRAAPYTRLGDGTFDKVMAFLDNERLVRRRDGSASIGYRSRNYFFSNISVIPDTVKFEVRSVVGNRIIASMDEQFAMNYLEAGATFITKGLPWKVVSIDKGVVYVEQSDDISAAVPDWDGEDIPVSRETAMRVYALMSQGIGKREAIRDDDTLGASEQFVKAQRKRFTPSEDAIVIEEAEGYAVVHAPLGKLANEYLAKLVAYAASAASGARISVKPTPYALIVDFAGARRKPDLGKIFDMVKRYDAGRENSMPFVSGTDTYRYRFVRICKLFGIVDRKAQIGKSNAERLVSFYSDSPIAEETARDLEKNSFDIHTVIEFLERLRKGAIHVSVSGGDLSPLAQEIVRASHVYREFLLPTLPDDAEIKELEAKIGTKKPILICTYCGTEFRQELSASGYERVFCPHCKSPLVCMQTDARSAAIAKKIAGKQLKEAEMRHYREAVQESGLVDAYGTKALAALSVYGIGMATAARVLRLLRKDRKRFIMDLLEAQKNFVRTKQYWK